MSKTKNSASQWAPKDQTADNFHKANFNTISNFSPTTRLPPFANKEERQDRSKSNFSSCNDFNALDDTDKTSLKSRLLKELQVRKSLDNEFFLTKSIMRRDPKRYTRNPTKVYCSTHFSKNFALYELPGHNNTVISKNAQSPIKDQCKTLVPTFDLPRQA